MIAQFGSLLQAGEQLAKSMAAMADLTLDNDADTQIAEAEKMTEEKDHETKDTDAATVHEGRCIQLLDLKTLALHAWTYCRCEP